MQTNFLSVFGLLVRNFLHSNTCKRVLSSMNQLSSNKHRFFFQRFTNFCWFFVFLGFGINDEWKLIIFWWCGKRNGVKSLHSCTLLWTWFHVSLQIDQLRHCVKQVLSVLIFGLFRYIPRYRILRERCAKLQNPILWLSLIKILYQRMSDYQQLLLYKRYNLSGYFVIFYDVIFYEPASRLLSPLINTTSSYPYFSRLVFVNTTSRSAINRSKSVDKCGTAVIAITRIAGLTVLFSQD